MSGSLEVSPEDEVGMRLGGKKGGEGYKGGCRVCGGRAPMWAPHHSCFVSVRVCIHLHMYMYMPCVCFRAYYAQVKCTYALLVAVREAKVRWTCDNGTVDVGTHRLKLVEA